MGKELTPGRAWKRALHYLPIYTSRRNFQLSNKKKRTERFFFWQLPSSKFMMHN